MKRRNFVRTAGLAGLAATVPMGGISLVRAQGPDRMVFITPQGYSLAFSSVLYAAAGGFYADEGLDVQVEGGRGAAQSVQLVAAGQAHVGRTGGGNYMIARVENDAPVISIATIAQTSPFYVISPTSAPIDEPEDFLGRTIGMASMGGSMEATMDLMLMRSGLDGTQVRRERVTDTPAAFGLIEANRIDGFFGNVSTTTRLLGEGYEINAFKVDDGIPGQVYVATDDDVAANEDMYVRFLRAELAAIRDIVARRDDLAPVIDVMRSRFDIPGSENTETAIADLVGNLELWTALGEDSVLRNDETMWAQAIDLMQRAGLLGEVADPSRLYTNALVDRAYGG